MRKVLIGLVSLGVVLGFYLLFGRYSERPDINTDLAPQAAADANAVDINQMGRIGDVGVGPAKKAYYITRDPKTQEIVREFGFEELLHQVRDVWEVKKPFMNVYRRNFKCYVTADKGQIHVETAVGRTTPKDATFSSNVVIHLVPTGKSTFKESFVYLDNIIFLGEKSLISTPGPVRLESEDARMYGKGLQIIYNEHAQRLEYFRIADLESLSYRVMNAQTPSSPSRQGPAEPNAPVEAQEPNETVVAAGSAEASDGSSPRGAGATSEQPEGEYYDCVLNDNVLIDTPGQLVFADERLHIHDIFWSRSFIDQADRTDPNALDEAETTGPAVAQEVQSDANVVEPNEAPEKPAFVVITCDGGLTIVPRDSTRMQNESMEADSSAVHKTGGGSRVSSKERREQLDDGTERTKFFARTIDYDATTGDMIAGGLSELTYYHVNVTENGVPQTRDLEPEQQVSSDEPRGTSYEVGPLKITAREGAKYTKASNEIVFTDCLCAMPQPGLTEQRDVTFSAPQITVDLQQGRARRPDVLAAGPIELAFYTEPAGPSADPNASAEDANRPATKGELTPVTVKARRRARYSGDMNQMAFEGDCQCTMLREDPNVVEKYMLLSERLTVDLVEDANDRTPGPAADIEHLTATGKVVRLATTRTRRSAPIVKTDEGRGARDDDGQLADHVDPNAHKEAANRDSLGGIELKCHQFDYDAVQQLYWATGPGGIITLNNQRSVPDTQDAGVGGPVETLDAQESGIKSLEPKTERPPSKVENPEPRFSLRDPCWAIVSGFETLTYSLLENRIVADAGPREKLALVYLPTGGRDDTADSSGRNSSGTGGDVTATASHVEVLLRETADGQIELATLAATGGILYEDDRGHQFIGSELFYDHTTAVVTVKGDEIQPCYYNGLLVDQIRYDVNTDKVECNAIGPSSIVF
ncbi:MAG: hypothetical protein P8Z79_14610 [Sedimentisphaerales bacterium]|jgi:hypothetical protein